MDCHRVSDKQINSNKKENNEKYYRRLKGETNKQIMHIELVAMHLFNRLQSFSPLGNDKVQTVLRKC